MVPVTDGGQPVQPRCKQVVNNGCYSLILCKWWWMVSDFVLPWLLTLWWSLPTDVYSFFVVPTIPVRWLYFCYLAQPTPQEVIPTSWCLPSRCWCVIGPPLSPWHESFPSPPAHTIPEETFSWVILINCYFDAVVKNMPSNNTFLPHWTRQIQMLSDKHHLRQK